MDLRAITICVDYGDLLGVTLKYNSHHFKEIYIVTTADDTLTRAVCRKYNNCIPVLTDLFYQTGKNDFNKWRALEYGLDYMRREGWICVLDADIVWPKRVKINTFTAGNLYTPYRRMHRLTKIIPEEREWYKFKRHRNVGEFAGYTQIFHANDPVLGDPPWYDVRWKHAGGADSFFQRKWNPSNKIRPDWDVLHLGPAGVNWSGRTNRYLSGDEPLNAKDRESNLRRLTKGRRKKGTEEQRFKDELSEN